MIILCLSACIMLACWVPVCRNMERMDEPVPVEQEPGTVTHFLAPGSSQATRPPWGGWCLPGPARDHTTRMDSVTCPICLVRLANEYPTNSDWNPAC